MGQVRLLLQLGPVQHQLGLVAPRLCGELLFGVGHVDLEHLAVALVLLDGVDRRVLEDRVRPEGALVVDVEQRLLLLRGPVHEADELVGGG